MLNRREWMQGMAAGTGGALGLSLLSDRLLAAPTSGNPLKRIVFFLQNKVLIRLPVFPPE